MKLSKYIKGLEKIKEKFGDLEVYECDEYSRFSETIFMPMAVLFDEKGHFQKFTEDPEDKPNGVVLN